MCNGDFFDERHGLDWLQNYVQNILKDLRSGTVTIKTAYRHALYCRATYRSWC
ncbi:Uncharacterised protein [Yersinia intermedia]|nr:Uncharacterised protein [Yersinia intermedia]